VLPPLSFNELIQVNLAIRDAPADLDEGWTLTGSAPSLKRPVVHVGMEVGRRLALVEEPR
jgi:hypothetical protein